MSYMLPDKDIPISEANYMSLYGATADFSIEAADEEANRLSIYNLNTHDTSHTTAYKPSIHGTDTSTEDQDDALTTLTHQSYDEALWQHKYRRKSTFDGTVGNSPIYKAIFNMLAGCGVVGLPVTYKNSGLCTGITMMIVVAILSVYTLRLQIDTGKKVKCEDYERLVSKCFGVWGYYLISFSILIFDIGACLTYTIILGNSARDVMDYLFGGFWGSFESRQIVIAVIYICLILPFALGKNFEFIEKVSALAIVVVIVMIFVVIKEYYEIYRYDTEVINKYYFDSEITPWITNDYISILSALGTISFAFIQHDLAFLVYKTLRNNTLERYTILAFLGMTIQCILCVIMATYGYLSFGQYTNDDVLTNYPIDNTYVLVVRILYTFRMAFVFPTAFYVVRHICYAIIFRGMETYEHATRIKQIIFTLIPWSAFLITGLFLDDLGFVMSLAGLLSALNIAFVLPSLCHLKVGTPYSILFWNAPKGQKCKAFIDTFPCVVMILFGTLAGVTGSIGLIVEQFGKL
eukprot:215465_1